MLLLHGPNLAAKTYANDALKSAIGVGFCIFGSPEASIRSERPLILHDLLLMATPAAHGNNEMQTTSSACLSVHVSRHQRHLLD